MQGLNVRDMITVIVQGCALALFAVGGAFLLVELTTFPILLDAGALSPYFLALDALAYQWWSRHREWSPENSGPMQLAALVLAGVAGSVAIFLYS